MPLAAWPFFPLLLYLEQGTQVSGKEGSGDFLVPWTSTVAVARDLDLYPGKEMGGQRWPGPASLPHPPACRFSPVSSALLHASPQISKQQRFSHSCPLTN